MVFIFLPPSHFLEVEHETKKKLDSKFRTGDLRFNPEVREVKHIILNPNMPPMYQLNDVKNPDKKDNRVAYTKAQLLVHDEHF